MNFIKQMVIKWIRDDWDNSVAPIRKSRLSTISSSRWEDSDNSGPELRADSMNFRLYKSVGGHILETQVYNERNDSHEHTLYMIREEEDFAQQVSHAIMMEMMKQ
jgi:hypothetical protein